MRTLELFAVGLILSLGAAACCPWAAAVPDAPPATAADSAPAMALAAAEPAPPADSRPAPPGGEPPATLRQDVSDTYHGVVVADPYRWLETWDDAEVQAWSDAQTAHARAVLDPLPGVAALRARITEVLAAPASTWWSLQPRGTAMFALKRQPPRQQPFLVVMTGDDVATERVIVDPNVIDPSGHTHIDFYAASPDGATVAVSMSHGGTESGDLHFYDVATGQPVFEVIERVNGGTAGGDVAWAPGGAGVYYTRYPRGAERPAVDQDFYVQLYHHTLGAPVTEDRYELGQGFPRIAEYQIDVDQASGRVLCTVQDGDGGAFAHHLRSPDGTWRTFTAFGDGHLAATFGPADTLYILSRAGAPRGKVLRLPIQSLDLAAAQVIIPEGADTIVEDFWGPATVVPHGDALYVLYQLGGPSTVRAFDLDGQAHPPLALPEVAAIGSMTPLDGGDLMVAVRSYTSPNAWLRVSAGSASVGRTSLSTAQTVDFSDVRVVREMATSKDGTQVPVNIVLPAGHARDGTGACLVYGYGGYGVNIEPRYRAANRVLFDQGVCYVVANIRGGGEFGEQWHRQGNLTHKQNVFDDFSAAVRHVVDRGYASADRVGIIGGSNGGLLMGATMVQNPALPKVVLSYVGIYDMLRVELSPNGAFNVTEFGTVKDPAQFAALREYSPYHNVREGTAYPPTLLITGANDPRVDPMQSRKFVAALQDASSAHDYLLRTSANAGHGGDSSLDQKIEEYVDVFAFAFKHLGVVPKALASPAPVGAPQGAGPATPDPLQAPAGAGPAPTAPTPAPAD